RLSPSGIDLPPAPRPGRADRTRAEASPAPATISQVLRRPAVAIAALAIATIAAVPATLVYRSTGRARWVRNDAIPQITQLVAKDDYLGAFALAQQVEHYSPNDPLL